MMKIDVKFTLSDDSHGHNDVGLFYTETFEYLQTKGVKTVYGLQRSDKGQGVLHVPFALPQEFLSLKN